MGTSGLILSGNPACFASGMTRKSAVKSAPYAPLIQRLLSETGAQINVLHLSRLSRIAEQAAANGADVEQAVRTLIATLRTN